VLAFGVLVRQRRALGPVVRDGLVVPVRELYHERADVGVADPPAPDPSAAAESGHHGDRD
jgi:hypothetical protein